MTVLRSLVFNLLFVAWTVLWLVLLFPTLALPRRALIRGVLVYMAGLRLFERRILGLDYRVLGREHLPEPPYLVAAKHQSAWETMALHQIIDDPAVVLKRELMRIPLWGWYAAKARMIAVDRGARSRAVASLLDGARRVAAEGRPIVIFPQGTRVAPGAWRPYRVGIAALYGELNLPVVPLALNSGVFWGRRAFRKHPGTITLEFLPAIPPGLPREAMLAQLEAALESASDRLVVAAGGPPTRRPAPTAAPLPAEP